MDRLLKRIQRGRPAEFCSREFFLLHDNAPAHKATIVCQFLTEKIIQPYITLRTIKDLSPPYHFLFSKLKMMIKDSTLRMLLISNKP
jgi:hypothetical protein